MGKFVRTYQPKEDAARESLVALAYRGAAGGMAPHTGPVAIAVEAVFIPPQSWSKKRQLDPGHKTTKPDLDNIVKSVLDGLNGIAFVDDSQIDRIDARKRFGDRNEIVVSMERIGELRETAE
jgi:Holliday junction resolvase RusA-like endonuclease